MQQNQPGYDQEKAPLDQWLLSMAFHNVGIEQILYKFRMGHISLLGRGHLLELAGPFNVPAKDSDNTGERAFSNYPIVQKIILF